MTSAGPDDAYDAEFERLDLVHCVLSDMAQAAQSLDGPEWVLFGAGRSDLAIEAMGSVADEMAEHLHRGREVTTDYESGWGW